MDLTSRATVTVLAVLLVPVLGVAIAPGAQSAGTTGSAATPLPEGHGKVIMERICVGCHSLSVVVSKRATPTEWTSVVQLMVSRGAAGSDQDLDTLTRYLANNFGPDAPQYALPKAPPSSANVPEITSSLSSSADADGVAPDISDNSVATTHVNVNHAGARKLESALSLTPEEAQTLIQYREKNGNFQNWQQVGEIPGVPAGKIIEYRNRLLF